MSILLTLLAPSYAQAESRLWAVETSQSPNRLMKALEFLNQTPTGKGLLQGAFRLWKGSSTADLVRNFSWGEASRTDTLLTRHFHPETGREEQEREIQIFLKADQPDLDLMLDMAHELVHATARPGFDPYDSSLTPSKYVRVALEGEGGEVAAVIKECEIGFEISERLGIPVQRCQDYLKKGSRVGERVDKDHVKRDFYRVGKWLPLLSDKLGLEKQFFPLLSSAEPKFFSSTGHSPYPAALLQEFEEITTMACTNSKKRMTTVASREAVPFHSKEQDPLMQESMRQFIQIRCKNIGE